MWLSSCTIFNRVVHYYSFSLAATVKKQMYTTLCQVSSGAWITLDELHEAIVMPWKKVPWNIPLNETFGKAAMNQTAWLWAAQRGQKHSCTDTQWSEALIMLWSSCRAVNELLVQCYNPQTQLSNYSVCTKQNDLLNCILCFWLILFGAMALSLCIVHPNGWRRALKTSHGVIICSTCTVALNRSCNCSS